MKEHSPKKWVLAILLATASLATAGNGLQLVESVKNGDIYTIQLLLDKPVNVNVAEPDGTTAMHWAAHRDDLEIAAMLIKSGANVSPVNEYGVSPLQLACINRSDEMVEMLLRAGADPDAALWTGETVLMHCARTGATKAVTALLTAGADVNASESNQGQTALMWAAAMGHSKIVKLLLEHGANVNSTTTATADKLPNTCRICPWKPSPGGFTSLLFAARSGDLETARMLVEAGADPDEATAEAGNSLVVASAGGHEKLALYLLGVRANPNSADENGVTALHHSFRHALSRMHGITYDPVYRVRPDNMPGLARALIEAGADPNAKIQHSYNIGPSIRDKCESISGMAGATPFMLAAISADISLMHLLQNWGAEPDTNSNDGTTPLMAAIQASCTVSNQRDIKRNKKEISRSLQAVKVIVEMEVDVNATNNDGETAMHMAGFAGAEPVVQFLAEQGAIVDIRNNSGETPWSMASGISPVLEDRGAYGIHESTADLLLRLGAVTISREEMQVPDPYLNPSDKAVSIGRD